MTDNQWRWILLYRKRSLGRGNQAVMDLIDFWVQNLARWVSVVLGDDLLCSLPERDFGMELRDELANFAIIKNHVGGFITQQRCTSIRVVFSDHLGGNVNEVRFDSSSPGNEGIDLVPAQPFIILDADLADKAACGEEKGLHWLD